MSYTRTEEAASILVVCETLVTQTQIALTHSKEYIFFKQMRSLPIMLLLLQRQQQQRHRPRLLLSGLCFPKLPASRASVLRASQAVLQQVATQPSISSGAPACPPLPRRTLPTARRATPARQPTVSFLLLTTPF